MSDEGGAARRRGLFRRNRADDDLLGIDLAELPPPDPEEVVIWDQTAASRARAPKRTADMFAPKESFSDTWSEDAWDDEWKEPAVRRTSIPPAADPTPQKVDEWLESGAGGFEDMTRDAVRKLGVDPALAAARSVRPGSTWDDTGDASTDDSRNTSARDESSVLGAEPSDPVLQATIERALSTAASAPVVLPEDTQAAGISKRFGRARSTLAGIGTDTSPAEQVESDAAVDLVASAGVESPLGEVSESVGEIATQPVGDDIIDVTDAVVSDIDSPLADSSLADSSDPDSSDPDSSEAPAKAWDRPVFAPSDPTSGDGARIDPVDPVDPVAVGQAGKQQASDQPSDSDAADEPGNKTADEHEVPATPDEEIEMDRTRAAAFTDRASWIGTGLAGVAVLRLALHVASNMKQADPAENSLGALARVGGGFANAGLMHGLLLIAAVTLLSLPALFDRDDLVPRRTGSGLGLVLGAALVGLIGSAVALLTQSTLADALGTRVTLGTTGEMLAALALSVVALGATMRALRSYDE